MDVEILLEAQEEFDDLPDDEREAMDRAFDKLEQLGDRLPAPHSSLVQGSGGLRELRPRQGRSVWRAFYRRIGPVLVIGAIGPEAQQDRAGFRRAVRLAEERLDRRETGRRRVE